MVMENTKYFKTNKIYVLHTLVWRGQIIANQTLQSVLESLSTKDIKIVHF